MKRIMCTSIISFLWCETVCLHIPYIYFVMNRSFSLIPPTTVFAGRYHHWHDGIPPGHTHPWTYHPSPLVKPGGELENCSNLGHLRLYLPTPLVLTSSGSHRSKRCASDWNAFLFNFDIISGSYNNFQRYIGDLVRLFMNKKLILLPAVSTWVQ